MSRCAAHSVSADDSGPIAAYIQAYAPDVPIRKMEAVEIPPAKPVKVPVRLMKRRFYYMEHKKEYGRYELARLKKMLAKETDHAKVLAILARIAKREVAPVGQVAADVADTVRRDEA